MSGSHPWPPPSDRSMYSERTELLKRFRARGAEATTARPVTADSLDSKPGAEGSTPSERAITFPCSCDTKCAQPVGECYTCHCALPALPVPTEGSSSGRTAGSDPANEGSTPSPSASLNYADLVDFFMRPVPYVITPRDFTPEEVEILDAYKPSYDELEAEHGRIPNVWSSELLQTIAKVNPDDYCSECGAYRG